MSMVNLEVGPCVIIWDPAGVNVTWRKTFGGVFFRYEEVRAEVKRDQAGQTIVNEVTAGAVNPELEAPFTDEDVSMFVHCFPNAKRVANSLQVSNPVGVPILPLAKQVIIKRIADGAISEVPAEWIVIHRAFPRVSLEQVYDSEGQRVVKVFFKGFPDDISGRQGRLWDYGRNAQAMSENRLVLNTKKSLYDPIEIEVDGQVYQSVKITRAVLIEVNKLDDDIAKDPTSTELLYRAIQILFAVDSNLLDKLDRREAEDIYTFTKRKFAAVETQRAAIIAKSFGDLVTKGRKQGSGESPSQKRLGNKQ